MTAIERIADAVTTHSKVVIVVMLLLSVAIGAGATKVEQDSSFSQFESDSDAARAQSFVDRNMNRGDDDTTTVQIIIRDDDGNVLTRDSFLRSLRYQQALRDDATVGPTLVENGSTYGVANVVAITAIVQNRSATLQARGDRLEARNQSLAEDFAQLQADRQAFQQRRDEVNATLETLGTELGTVQALQRQYDQLNASNASGAEYEQQAAAIEAKIAAAKGDAAAAVDAEGAPTFNATASQVRTLQHRLHELNRSLAAGRINQSQYDERTARVQQRLDGAYTKGTQGVLADELAALEADGEALAARADELTERQEALQADFAAFQADLQAFQQTPPTPTLDEQLATLESMNDSEVRDLTTTVLSGEDRQFASEQALQLMPTNYTPGSDTATARMLFITQARQSSAAVNSPNAYSETVTDAQLQMQDIGQRDEFSDGEEYIVFGFGVINEEIQQSMSDSMQIVGPMALLFVLLTLLIAYRDLLDIVLGVFGILLVLVWTWGFMGWYGISFNQIMIAVPVLLIGLSIDYAIHTFMRHREARAEANGEDDPRGSMRLALAGVGVALVWVTATTIIGFMSNLISPLGPIQDFGIASSAGITATLLVFGALVPAMKVEIDGAMEHYLGWDRTKRAFGTGGGALGSLLGGGAAAAKRAPVLVILVALALTAAGAAGATQVDTTFEQSDFLADDPPDIFYELPEPFKPGEYSAKGNLDYVYSNFQSPDQQAQILVNGTVTRDDTLERMDDARESLTTKDRYRDTIYVGPSGETSIVSPVTVMRDVAARNESFNQTFQRTDTDDDGVPDRNLTGVYDHLYEVAPDQAQTVVYRDADGDYTAVRMRVSLKGTATTAAVAEDMRHVANRQIEQGARGDLDATATGDPIVSEIVQGDLLDTVIESLIVTLVAVFVFLMITYRLTDGSATLGIVTLLPVALSVAWILGTMYVLSIPFNVVTGTITSLTVGLGVAYSIHLSERYNLELERQDHAVWPAMRTSVTGTGGALLGSAATTAGGFGVLAFALLPALQQFGIITGITIVYAFLASVFVLPSMLVVWTRYVGPDDADFDSTTVPSTTDEDDDDPLGGDASGSSGALSNGGADAEEPTPDTEPLGVVADDPADADAETADAETADADAETADAETLDAAEVEDGESAAEAADAGTDPSPLAPGEDGDDAADGAVVDAGESGIDETHAGPPDADVATEPASDDPLADPDATDATVAAASTPPAPTADTDDGDDGPRSDDDAPTDGDALAGGTAAAAASGVGGPRGPVVDAERSVAPTDPAPGDSVTVSVVARDVSGHVVLRESVPGTGGRIESFDPAPLARTKDGRTVYVVWSLDEATDIGMTYATNVPEDAAGGDRFTFEGSVETPDGESTVGGDAECRVITPFLERLRGDGSVTDDDVAEAADLAAEGDLTGEAFEEVYREWLAARDDDVARPQFDGGPAVEDGGDGDR